MRHRADPRVPGAEPPAERPAKAQEGTERDAPPVSPGEAALPLAEGGAVVAGARRVDITPEEYEALRHQAGLATEYLDRLARVQAEYENARKRLQREKQEAVTFANERLLRELLPIVDSFERALAAFDGRSGDPVADGIRLIQTQLEQMLQRVGVVRIDALGRPFSPDLHEVVGQVPSDPASEGVVVEEVRAGYLLQGRLLRPAAIKIGQRIGPEDAPSA